MTILTSTTATDPYKAPWRENDPDAPAFLFRTGSVIERGQMEAELSGEHRAGKVWPFELRAAVRSGVLTLLADDPDLDKVVELIDAEGSGETVELTDDDKTLLDDTRKILAQYWPEYRDLLAQMERRKEIAPLVALRRFCVDITGKGVTFARGKDNMVSDATLAAIDPLELQMAGSRAYALQFPPVDAVGNLPGPESSDSAPKTSSKDDGSKEAGKSTRRSGKKTPVS